MASATVTAPPAAGPGDAVYVGSRPFQTGEPLFGRDEETAALTSLLVAERVVLLYSPSGAGKTSLIQAGLVPELRPRAPGARGRGRGRPFHVPTDGGSTDAKAPAVVIRVHTPTDLKGVNRYVLSALGSLEKHRPEKDRRPPEQLVGMTLSDYLKAEFITRSPRADGKSGEEFHPTVLIIDQFEEVLTADPTDTAAKREFFDQLGVVLADRERWVLIAIREDHLAALDPYLPLLPTRLDARYRLDRLSPAAALDAIISPADRALGAPPGTRGVGFSEAAAERLVADLRLVRVQQPDDSFVTKPGPHVEPVHLQVVCKSLWDMKPNRTAADPVTVADIEELGTSAKGQPGAGGGDRNLIGIDWVLARYYATKVREAAVAGAVSERRIRDWFEKRLITLTRSRRPVPRGEEKQFGITPDAADVLDHAYLIREDVRGGTHWLELAHDRLIEPVLRDNASWRANTLHSFQRDAAIWAETRQASVLLAGPGLAAAQEWANARPELLSPEDREFLDASRERQEQANRDEAAREATQEAGRRNRYIGIGIGVLVGLLAVIGVLFFTGRRSGLQEAARVQEQARLENIYAQRLREQQAKQQREKGEAQTTKLLSDLQRLLVQERDPLGANIGLNQAKQTVFVVAEAARIAPNWGYLPEAEECLRRILQQAGGEQSRERLDGAIRVIAFSPSGKRVAVGAEGSFSRVYDLTKGPLHGNAGNQLGYKEGITAAAFTPNEEYVIWGDPTGRVVAEKFGATGEDPNRYLSQFPTHASAVRSIRLSNAVGALDNWNGWIVTVSSDGRGNLFKWKPNPGAKPVRINEIGRLAEPRMGQFPGDQPALLTFPIRAAQPPPMPGRPISVTSVEFTPLPKKLFAGTTDGHIYSWNLEGGNENPPPTLVKRAATDTAVTALAIHPQALHLAVGTFRPKVRLWPMDPYSKDISESVTAKPFEELDTPAVESLQFHHTGKWLAAVSRDQTVQLFRSRPANNQPPAYEPVTLGSNRSAWVFGPGSAGRVTVVAFDPHREGPGHQSRELFLAGYPDGTARLWDLTQVGQAPFSLSGHRSGVTAVAIHPDQSFALIGYQDGTVTTWDIGALLRGDDAEPRVFHGPTTPITQLGASPSGKRFVAIDKDGGVVNRSLDPTGVVIQRMIGKGCLGVVPQDDSVLVIAPPRGAVRDAAGTIPLSVSRWHPATDKFTPLSTFRVPNPPLAFALSGDRSLAAIIDANTTAVTLVKLSSDQPPTVVATVPIPPPAKADAKQVKTVLPLAGAVALSGDGRVLVCAAGPRVIVWQFDPATGQAGPPKFLPPSLFDGDRLVLAVRGDGRVVAVGNYLGEVRLWTGWDDERPKPWDLPRHKKAVTALAFTEDGTRLVSGSEDTTARIHDLRGGPNANAPVELSGHTGAIRALAITSKEDKAGPRLVTSGDDGTVRVWTLDRTTLLTRAKALLNARPKAHQAEVGLKE